MTMRTDRAFATVARFGRPYPEAVRESHLADEQPELQLLSPQTLSAS
jgi:hypothetical protein